MKQRKKIFLLTLLLLMSMTSLTAQASSTKTKALKSYAKLLSKSKISTNKLKSSGCSFALAYIDNNSVPELVIKSFQLGSSNGYYVVYTYKNGKAVQIGNLLGTSFGYYKKKGVFRDMRYFTHPMGGPGDQTTYYKLSNGKITSMLSKAVYEPDPFYKRTKSMYYYYYCAGSDSSNYKSIKKSNYNSRLKKLIGSKTLTKDTKMKFYKNTAANRKKYLK